MQMRPGGLPRRSDKRNPLTSLHRLPCLHEQLAAMAIQRYKAAAVVNFNVVAVARVLPGGQYRSVGEGADVCTRIGCEVGSIVEFDRILQRVNPVAKAG